MYLYIPFQFIRLWHKSEIPESRSINQISYPYMSEYQIETRYNIKGVTWHKFCI